MAVKTQSAQTSTGQRTFTVLATKSEPLTIKSWRFCWGS